MAVRESAPGLSPMPVLTVTAIRRNFGHLGPNRCQNVPRSVSFLGSALFPTGQPATARGPTHLICHLSAPIATLIPQDRKPRFCLAQT